MLQVATQTKIWKSKFQNETVGVNDDGARPTVCKKLNLQKFKYLKRESLRGLVKGTSQRPRLSVYRSNENIYAQIIDDTTSQTLVSCSTLDRDILLDTSNGRTCDASRLMGQKLAKLSLKKNITQIVFDRGPYFYHGRIKALADGARAGGLQF